MLVHHNHVTQFPLGVKKQAVANYYATVQGQDPVAPLGIFVLQQCMQ